jgi:hypothetical protein
MISSPFPFVVQPSWLLEHPLWQWDNSANQYVRATSLLPWRAYWTFSSATRVLALREGATPPLVALAKTAAGSAWWHLHIALRGASSADPDNHIGVAPLDEARLTVLNSPEPPPAMDFPHVYVAGMSAGSKSVSGLRMADYFVSGQRIPDKKIEWMVGLSPAREKTDVTIDGIAELPSQLYAFWVSGEQVVNLRKESSVSVASHAQTEYGYIVVTPNAADLALYTGQFMLKNNFPNPFSRQTTIEYVVPYEWKTDGSRARGEHRQLSLVIYNAAGQKVRTLLSGDVKVGMHRTLWDGKNNAGRPMPAGFYVARLECRGNFDKSIKMLMVR